MRLSLLALAGVVGCTQLTNVAAPDLVQPGDLNSPNGALTRRAGALGQFYVDVSAWAMFSGAISDELTDVVPSGAPIDQRVIPDNGPSNTADRRYPGPVTRTNVLTAIALLERYAPTPGSRIGEMFAALGTIETHMAEDLCSGIRLAGVSDGVPTPADPSTTTQVYRHALAQLDSAARYAADSARILDWVAIVRGRILLDLDSAQAAAAAVAGVPTGYRYVAQYSIAANQMDTIAEQLLLGNYSVSDREGINGLNFVSAGDPRVQVVDLGIALDRVDHKLDFAPFTSYAAPLTVAGGIEARLIQAEAALAAGQVGTWTNVLNALRADSAETGIAGLPPLTADSTTGASSAERLDVMFRERAFWLFASGHRQGDLRRLIRQYGRTQDQVFPTGPYQHTAESYGSDITFPVYHDEANTLVAECIDRKA